MNVVAESPGQSGRLASRSFALKLASLTVSRGKPVDYEFQIGDRVLGDGGWGLIVPCCLDSGTDATIRANLAFLGEVVCEGS